MIQRYFAGDLLPDQEKSWKAEDGLFVLYADHFAALEAAVREKDKQIAGRDRVICTLKEDKGFLKQEIASLTNQVDNERKIKEAEKKILLEEVAKNAVLTKENEQSKKAIQEACQIIAEGIKVVENLLRDTGQPRRR